jgi:hypothetical protein
MLRVATLFVTAMALIVSLTSVPEPCWAWHFEWQEIDTTVNNWYQAQLDAPFPTQHCQGHVINMFNGCELTSGVYFARTTFNYFSTDGTIIAYGFVGGSKGDADNSRAAGGSILRQAHIKRDTNDSSRAKIIISWELSSTDIHYVGEGSYAMTHFIIEHYVDWLQSAGWGYDDELYSSGYAVVADSVYDNYALIFSTGAVSYSYWDYGVLSGHAEAAVRVDLVDAENSYCPDFDPWNWTGRGLPNFQNKNNCYNYATNRHTGSYAQPGKGSGQIFTEFTCNDIKAAVLRDGLTPTTLSGDCGGDCKVALMIKNAGFAGPDFHWLREHPDGTWSHKMGSGVPTDRDASGNTINSPEGAIITNPADGHRYFICDETTAYYCVPPEAIIFMGDNRPPASSEGKKHGRQDERENFSTHAHARAPILGNYIVCEPLLYYGRPNPKIMFADSLEIATIIDKLQDLPPTDDPQWQSYEPYVSFTLTSSPMKEYLLPNAVEYVVVRDGVIAFYDPANYVSYYEDIYDLEGWLIDYFTANNEYGEIFKEIQQGKSGKR